MQLNMTTFAHRKMPYLRFTLKSLFDSDWPSDGKVNLIVGSEDESHLREYAAHPSIRVIHWDVETNPNLRWNCTLNKIRALRHGDDAETLICEDDVSFRRDWYACLQEARAELADESYVLSLFAARPQLDKAELIAGRTWIKEYPSPTLQGAQAVFYPSLAIRHEVADYLTQNLQKGCGDDLIGRYARGYAALYATREILVDHIGAVSCFHV